MKRVSQLVILVVAFSALSTSTGCLLLAAGAIESQKKSTPPPPDPSAAPSATDSNGQPVAPSGTVIHDGGTTNI